jgi:GTP cyclohydrolase II
MDAGNRARFASEAAEHLRRTGRPLVSLSWAQSIDGAIALERGQRLALSGPASSAFTHGLRAAHDAILVGIGTVLSDDPLLTVRLAAGADPQPVVLDARLRFPLTARLLSENPRRPWILTAEPGRGPGAEELESRGAVIVPVPSDGAGFLDLAAALMRLGARGVSSLLVEGGGLVITSFLKARLADRVVVTIAPVFVGGYPAVGAPTAASANLVPRLSAVRVERAGDDLLLSGRLAP